MKLSFNFKTTFLYLIFTFIMICTLLQKTNYHNDEIFSYGLANHVQHTKSGIDMEFEQYKRYDSVSDFFLDFLAVKPGEQFNYHSVFINQSNDVHPPFYYCVLHTICSLRPNTFSRWYAGLINMISALITLFFMRKILRLLHQTEIAVNLISLAFAISAGIHNIISFFRMYSLAMCFLTVITYIFVEQVDKKDNKFFYLKIYLLSIPAVLTHYYCTIYITFLCVVFGIYLLFEKVWKDVFKFCATMLLAAGTSILIYPTMVHHMFLENKGLEAIDSISQTSNYISNFSYFFNMMDAAIFGKLFGFILLALLLYVLYIHTDMKSFFTNDVNRSLLVKLALMFIPSFLYFCLVSIIAGYIEERYMFPVYAIIFTGFMTLVVVIVKHIFDINQSYLLIIILLSSIVVGSWRNIEWKYLYKESQDILENAKNYSDMDCICIYNCAERTIHSTILENLNYRSIIFAKQKNIDYAALASLVQSDGVVINLIVKHPNEYLENFRNAFPQFPECDYVGEFNNNITFCLHR